MIHCSEEFIDKALIFTDKAARKHSPYDLRWLSESTINGLKNQKNFSSFREAVGKCFGNRFQSDPHATAKRAKSQGKSRSEKRSIPEWNRKR